VPELEPSDPLYGAFMKPINTYLKSASGEAIPAADQIDDVHSCSDVKPSVTISMPANCSGSCTITATVTAGTKTPRNLYFKMDGVVMAGGARDISGGGSYSYEFEPATSGPREFSAEVVDEALYDATASTTSTLLSEPFSIFDITTQNPTTVRIRWNNLSSQGAPYSIYYSGTTSGIAASPTCDFQGGYCVKNITITPGGNYTFRVESDGGRSTPTKSL
jgi:hypothetical protein